MTNFEKAVEIAVADIKHVAIIHGVDWARVQDWNDLLKWINHSHGDDMKRRIYDVLCRAANMGNLEGYPMDDCSIEDSDGSIKTYRQLTNAIRKQLFA